MMQKWDWSQRTLWAGPTIFPQIKLADQEHSRQLTKSLWITRLNWFLPREKTRSSNECSKQMTSSRYRTNQPSHLFIDGYSHFLNYPYLHRVYPLHRHEMDQLLTFWSDGHVLHTELLRLDAPSAITPRAATGSLRNRTRWVLRPKLCKIRHP
jgi:hypothetical protein